MPAAVETRTIEPDEAGMRLDRWFKAHYPDVSFGHLQKLLRSGQVRVDGGRVKTSTRLEPGQAVRVPPLGGPRHSTARATLDAGGGTFDAEQSRHRERGGKDTANGPDTALGDSPSPRRGQGQPKAQRGPISDGDFLRSILLHEDDDVFVFNKPPGLAVQGGSGLTRHIDAMLDALRDRKGQKPRLVHRLDRDTSGVLVVARTRLAASALAAS